MLGSNGYKIVSEYTYPINSFKQVVRKKRMDQMNIEFFTKMSSIFEGLFKLIDKINEVNVNPNGSNQVPYIKSLEDMDIGVKGDKKEKVNDNDIIFRDRSLLVSYTHLLSKDFLKDFKGFGNKNDVNYEKVGKLNWIKLYFYWSDSMLSFFSNISFVMTDCFKLKIKANPFEIIKCPTLVLNILGILNELEFECLKTLEGDQFPTDYKILKSAI